MCWQLFVLRICFSSAHVMHMYLCFSLVCQPLTWHMEMDMVVDVTVTVDMDMGMDMDMYSVSGFVTSIIFLGAAFV